MAEAAKPSTCWIHHKSVVRTNSRTYAWKSSFADRANICLLQANLGLLLSNTLDTLSICDFYYSIKVHSQTCSHASHPRFYWKQKGGFKQRSEIVLGLDIFCPHLAIRSRPTFLSRFHSSLLSWLSIEMLDVIFRNHCHLAQVNREACRGPMRSHALVCYFHPYIRLGWVQPTDDLMQNEQHLVTAGQRLFRGTWKSSLRHARRSDLTRVDRPQPLIYGAVTDSSHLGCSNVLTGWVIVEVSWTWKNIIWPLLHFCCESNKDIAPFIKTIVLAQSYASHITLLTPQIPLVHSNIWI